MGKSIVSQGVSNVLGRAAELLRLLEEAGLPFEAWQIPIDDPKKRELLVEYWRGLAGTGVVPPLAIATFYNARKVNELFPLELTEEQLRALPPAPEPLNGYVTFFDPGWSIMKMRDWNPNFFAWGTTGSYINDEFFTEQDEPRYRQILMMGVPSSSNQNLDEQMRRLREDQEVPTARQFVTANVLRLVSGGTCFSPKTFMRTSSITRGMNVDIGNNEGQIVLGSDFHGRAFMTLALAGARKL
jgi:hypothetical protein